MRFERDDGPRSPNPDAEERGHRRRAVVASTIGTAIEWYDYFLYGTAAALVFPELFFTDADPTAGTLASFATFAVGFAARPLGSAIFGHYGDRIGRKATLVITLTMMGVASTLIGVLPTHADIGLVAPLLLTLLRICQGIAVGGEWSGSVLLAMEWGDGKRRGFFASWPQFGVPIGLLLGNGAMLGSQAIMSEDAFLSWGWRLPFIFSLVLLVIGLYVRLAILETPVFRRALQEQRIERRPVVAVIKRHPREILLTALVRMADQAPFYIFTAFVLTYGTKELDQPRSLLLGAVMVAAALELFTIPFFGALSDRVGRKRLYLLGTIATALIAFPYFALLDTGVTAIIFITIALSLIPHDMLYAPQAALIAETFTTRLRYSGAGLGYQLASVFAGGPAPLIATALLTTALGSWAIAGYLVLCSAVTLVALLLLPDRSREDITEEYDEPVRAEPAGAEVPVAR
jgi:metabolite-proton symporter